MTATIETAIAGSFRDPSGHLFTQNNILYRQVNFAYQHNYDLLKQSGLYSVLTEQHLLVAHQELDAAVVGKKAFKILQPQLIPFISYPYEWSFSQLKDAALLTLDIQKKALEHGMSLKDASAYNVQFLQGKPIFIDSLSFEEYIEGKPWVAYRQFCKHFLAPLALMAYRDYRLIELLRTNIDGIPLDIAAMLLPKRTRYNLSLAMHIHLHAKSEQKYADKSLDKEPRPISKMQLLGIIDSLETTINKLKWTPEGTEWADYYENTNYSDNSMRQKEGLVSDFLDFVHPETVWDLGANDGRFSRIADQKGLLTVAFDIDPGAVEKNYLRVKNGNGTLLPLVMDLTNPSPAIGWNNTERSSIKQRGPVDCAMALALLHHLAISNNLPFDHIARFFAGICKWLIIEFVPKDDSQVLRLLRTREDIFTDYHAEAFENSFATYFGIEKSEPIADSKRTLYLMKRL